MMNAIPSMLSYLLQKQGRGDMSPEEQGLLAASQGQEMPQQMAEGPKESWLRSLFSRKQPDPQPQSPEDAARKAEGLFDPGSIGDQLRRRREQADQLGKEISLAPEDMILAQGPDPYGGVSMQTRAGLAKLGAEDPTGDLGDMAIGRGKTAAPAGYAAKTSVRGAQTSTQEDQLTKMLIGRGMSEKEARARAKSIQ